ncbi:MAG: hypothetical protein FWG67_03965 [Defluviitaleaceae bacterium]|nr:hypothetical protein [Defluviitaleaceae bacterium]
MNEEMTQLSPPIYTYFNALKHTIGNDPELNVFDMVNTEDGNYLIQVDVAGIRGHEKAQALATIVDSDKTVMGDTKVFVEFLHRGQVIQPFENVINYLTLFNTAFKTNRLYVKIESTLSLGKHILYPIFEKEVIQFFNDDLSDFHQNFNGVAASVFRDVLKEFVFNVQVLTTTEDKQ